MIEADHIRKAQALLDRWRRNGAEVYVWRGEIHVTGAKPSGQRLAQMRKHEQAIRQLHGDDGGTHPWAVSQLPGGTTPLSPLDCRGCGPTRISIRLVQRSRT